MNKLHADLLNNFKSVADVRLISAFADPRLQVSDKDTLYVFFPDIHLISKKRLDEGKFKFFSNHTELLPKALSQVKKLKMDVEAAGQSVQTYHIGDLLDLWRETPTLDDLGNSATAIERDFPEIIEALTDPDLEARFLLGNHDFDLYRYSNYREWERRFYIPDYRDPKGIVLHGDIFDWIEKLPEALKQLFVYYFAPEVSPGKFNIGQEQADRYVHRFNGSRDYQNFIQAPQPLKIGSFAPADTLAPFNVSTLGAAPDERLQFLSKAQELCLRANEEFKISLNCAIIGHTHHPRIAFREDAGKLFTLVDCGAWIETCCTDTDGTAIKSAHVTALSENEIRIYQLSPPPITSSQSSMTSIEVSIPVSDS